MANIEVVSKSAPEDVPVRTSAEADPVSDEAGLQSDRSNAAARRVGERVLVGGVLVDKEQEATRLADEHEGSRRGDVHDGVH